MTKHIGLFGGSFDPPHLGHQALVNSAFEVLNLDEIWVIPVGLPVHRTLSGKASNVQRFTWLTQMFADEKRVKIIDWEIHNLKPTPAIDTLHRFKAENPLLTPTWLMGMDSFHDLPNWVDYPTHQNLCNLAVFKRKEHKTIVNTTGWNDITLHGWQQSQPLQSGHVVMLNADLPDVSSTLIRQNVMQQQQLLPQSTCNAISACYAWRGKMNDECKREKT